jgi:hypothetical protein
MRYVTVSSAARPGSGSFRRRWAQRLLIDLAVPLLAVLHATALEGQSKSAIQVSLGAHALTVPWYPGPVTDGFDPFVMAGGDRSLRSGEHWTLSFGINLGFFRDYWWMTGLSVEPELRIGRRLPGGFHTDLGLGLGYMHYFWRRETLELRDGRYVDARDRGSPSLILPLSWTLGYRGSTARPLVVSPFVSARWGVQLLFKDEVPVMTHLSLSGGIRIQRNGGT